MKKCSECKLNKLLVNFCKSKNRPDGLYYYCKECQKIRREKSKDYTQKYNKLYAENNKEKIKQIKNKYKKTEKGKATRNKNYKTFASNNREKINVRAKKWRNNNPLVKVILSLRCRLRKFIKRTNNESNASMMQILGCDKEFFLKYLENKFTKGMSWDNYGTFWHIDHIIPISSGKTVDELEKLSHYTNLQPLEAIVNIKKGNKINVI